MEKYIDILESVRLFEGIASKEIYMLLPCISSRLVRFRKGDAIFARGEFIKEFGIVLHGQIEIVQDDCFGNRSIIAKINAGNFFGESFACARGKALPFYVDSVRESEVLFIDCRKLASPCEKACSFHNRLIQNLLSVVSVKNIELTQKIELLSRRSTREKLLAYLSYESEKTENPQFSIPFNRQELADYLSVERSAMSAELSKLKKDGILDFHKNSFKFM